MSTQLLLRTEIRRGEDVAMVRQRARLVAELVGLDRQEQTRLATAISEIARNAFDYAGGGMVEFGLDTSEPGALLVRISDTGPGIAAVNPGEPATTGTGMGLAGARRLVDHFEIVSEPGSGTQVTLGKTLSRRIGARALDIAAITSRLAASPPGDPLIEVAAQNAELMHALEELQIRQLEVERLTTELAETNRGVLALYAELDDRAMQLTRASELKSNFLSHISHELRTPLNSILNMTRLLLDRMDGSLTAEQDRQVSLIATAARSLLDDVNNLLDLARIEAGKTALRLSDVAVADVLAAVRGMLRPLLTTDAVTFTVLPVSPGWTMHTDEGKLSQILRNLVSNAIKFTERGEIRLSAVVTDETVVFTVSDTGIGIAPEDQPRIFEQYFQIDNPLQHRVQGSGLGLPLSRQLARLLGGDLTVTSELGVGSTFTLHTPRIIAPSRELDAAPAEPNRDGWVDSLPSVEGARR